MYRDLKARAERNKEDCNNRYANIDTVHGIFTTCIIPFLVSGPGTHLFSYDLRTHHPWNVCPNKYLVDDTRPE